MVATKSEKLCKAYKIEPELYYDCPGCDIEPPRMRFECPSCSLSNSVKRYKYPYTSNFETDDMIKILGGKYDINIKMLKNTFYIHLNNEYFAKDKDLSEALFKTLIKLKDKDLKEEVRKLF